MTCAHRAGRHTLRLRLPCCARLLPLRLPCARGALCGPPLPPQLGLPCRIHLHSSWSADERSTDCEPTNDSTQGRTLKSAELGWPRAAAGSLREVAATGRSGAGSYRRGARRARRGRLVQETHSSQIGHETLWRHFERSALLLVNGSSQQEIEPVHAASQAPFLLRSPLTSSPPAAARSLPHPLPQRPSRQQPEQCMHPSLSRVRSCVVHHLSPADRDNSKRVQRSAQPVPVCSRGCAGFSHEYMKEESHTPLPCTSRVPPRGSTPAEQGIVVSRDDAVDALPARIPPAAEAYVRALQTVPADAIASVTLAVCCQQKALAT